MRRKATRCGSDDLSLYIHDLATSFRIELEGSLSGKAVMQVEQSWRTASSVIGNRSLVIAVGNVSNIDPAGHALLRGLHEAGAQFVAKSPAADALVAAITGQQIVSLMESDKQDRSAPRPA
jgi:hypothetical protein